MSIRNTNGAKCSNASQGTKITTNTSRPAYRCNGATTIQASKIGPGTIINYPHAAPLGDLSIAIGALSRTESAIGPLSTKFRYFIVLVKLLNHMLVLLLYSFGRRGIGHKPEKVRDEYMCLKVENSNAPCKNDTKLAPLEVRQGLSFTKLETSNVHLMGAMPADYRKTASIVGRLTAKSTKALIREFQKMLNGAIQAQNAPSGPPVAVGHPPNLLRRPVSNEPKISELYEWIVHHSIA